MIARGAAGVILPAFALFAVGCSAPGTPPTASRSLDAIVIESPGPGFSVNSRVTGPMDLDTASNATESPPAGTRKTLEDAGFGGGYVRVWNSGNQYMGDQVLSFDHPVDAQRFADYEVTFLKAQVSAFVFPEPSIPGATGFLLNGTTRTRPNIFCEGIWFAVDVDAFNLYYCDPQHPVAAAPLEAAATAQYRAALLRQLGTAAPGANPTPSSP